MTVYSPGASVEAAAELAEVEALAELALTLSLAALEAALALALAELADALALAALEDELEEHPATAMIATSIMAAMTIPIPFFICNTPLLPARHAGDIGLQRELLLGTGDGHRRRGDAEHAGVHSVSVPFRQLGSPGLARSALQ